MPGALWQAIAIGALAYNAQMALALPIVGPQPVQRHSGLTLVQTGN